MTESENTLNQQAWTFYQVHAEQHSMAANSLMTFTACACSECQAMCRRRPCWPTPLDAQRLIDAGYADRLMIDWWFDQAQDRTVYVLTPSIAGRESGEAPAHPSGRCTFLNENSLCDVHDLDLKPTEGRIALCHDRTPPHLHEQIGQTWDGDEGRSVIDRWETDPPRGRRRAWRATLEPQPARTKRSNRRRQLAKPSLTDGRR